MSDGSSFHMLARDTGNANLPAVVRQQIIISYAWQQCKTLFAGCIVLQAEITKLNYEEGTEEKLLLEKKKLSQEVQNLQEKLECLEAK